MMPRKPRPSRPVGTVEIGGRRWRVEFGDVPVNADAFCEPPEAKHKRIVLRRSLARSPRVLCEALIHEALHASSWPLSEEFVTQFAEDCERLLYKLGFRRLP